MLKSGLKWYPYGTEMTYKNKNFAALFKNKLAPIGTITDTTSTIMATYAGGVPALATGQKDMNTTFRELDESAKKVIEAATRAK
ncbi:MAG: hypothetical protein K0Q59_4075 [Paenibacillus sp.]|nr:hypothetical protein [Paenibacillus sp.]